LSSYLATSPDRGVLQQIVTADEDSDEVDVMLSTRTTTRSGSTTDHPFSHSFIFVSEKLSDRDETHEVK